MTPSAANDSDVRLTRQYRASPDEVFAAFTTPGSLEAWLAPHASIATKVLEFDFRVGGHYRISFALPDGNTLGLFGEYIEVTPPRRLVFSWTWEPPDPHAGVISRVTVTLRSIPDGTELSLHHAALNGAPMAARHHKGWIAALDRLAQQVHSTLKEPSGSAATRKANP